MLTITLVYEIPHVFFSSNFYYIIIYRSTGYLKTTRNDPLQALTQTWVQMQGCMQMQHAGVGVLMQRTGRGHRCSAQARRINAACRPGASTRCAGWGYRHGAQARGIDVVRMPGVSARRGRGIGPLRRARGLDPACRGRVLTQRVGALTRHAWVGLTRHAGVSTRHAGTGGVDAGQGCSQGEGGGSMRKRSPFDPLLGQGRAWLWRHEKNRTPTRSHLRRGWGLGHENPLSHAWSEGDACQQTKHVTFT